MINLLVTNVDGARVDGSWEKQPTDSQLLYHIGGMWEDDMEAKIIRELLSDGYSSVEDSACTTYELT